MDFTTSITWDGGGGGGVIRSEEKYDLTWLQDLL